MSERDAFGPNLRRIRVQRGISIDEIAEATNVSAALWEGLERNDLSRWPTGIYARSYVRSYAKAIGADPESTVDEFCRWFPQGDRRAELVIRGQAEIVGHHDLQWRDRSSRRPSGDGERRGGAAAGAARAAAGVTGSPVTALLRPPARPAPACASTHTRPTPARAFRAPIGLTMRLMRLAAVVAVSRAVAGDRRRGSRRSATSPICWPRRRRTKSRSSSPS